jgi:pre-mRNA-processing factor SLU7
MIDKGATSDRAAAMVAEEDFIRSSGDAAEFERLQRSAWESQERGDKNKLHLQANPTEAEALRRRLEKERAEASEKKRRELLAKYGGAEHLEKAVEVEEEERYVEYTESGAVKGETKVKPKSKYVEDKYIGNHTSVWGSWWDNFQWGYTCCHSTVKNSYCSGKEGIAAADMAKKMRLGLLTASDSKESKESKEVIQAKDQDYIVKEQPHREGISGLKASGGGGKTVEGEEKEGKRKLEHMLGGVTEEDMETYRKQKRLHDDPMANFVDAV